MRLALVSLLATVAACGFPPLPQHDDAAAVDGSPNDGPSVPLDGDGPLPIDGDGPPPSPMVTGSAIPLRVAVNDAVTLTFTVMAEPSTTVAWTIQPAASGGSFQPMNSTVATNGSGVALISVMYTASVSSGDLAHSLRLTSALQATSTHPFETKVRILTPIGDDTSYADNAGVTVAADQLYGQLLTTSSTPVVLMRLALISHGPGYSGRMALYSDVGGEPSALAATSAVEPIPTGVKEFRLVQPVMLAPSSSYWLLGNFTASAPIRRHATTTTSVKYVPLTTTATLPATLGATSTSGHRRLNYYILVAN